MSQISPCQTFSSLYLRPSLISPPFCNMSPMMGAVRSVEGWNPRPTWTRPVLPDMMPEAGKVTRQPTRVGLPTRARTVVVPTVMGRVRVAVQTHLTKLW
jgi:hypothetical protein